MTRPRHHRPADLSRVDAWEARTAWPLFAGSVVFVGVLTWLWVTDSMPHQGHRFLASSIIAVLWAWFLADYLIRLVLAAGARGAFLRTRVFDLASLLLPLLRPFLILVYVWRLPVFRRGDSGRQRLRYILVTVLFAFMYVYTCAYGVWLVERHAPGASIVNFGDALWWGFETISTVGYGDFVPVTIPGRFIAVGLMVGGIFVIGVVTATLISDLNDRIRSAVRSAHAERSEHPDPHA